MVCAGQAVELVDARDLSRIIAGLTNVKAGKKSTKIRQAIDYMAFRLSLARHVSDGDKPRQLDDRMAHTCRYPFTDNHGGQNNEKDQGNLRPGQRGNRCIQLQAKTAGTNEAENG